MRNILVLAFLLIAVYTATVNASSTTPPQDHEQLFRQTVNDYIEAIQKRDLDGIINTITTGKELILIFPGGTTLYTRQEYVDFHQQWFGDQTWTMQLEPVSYLIRENFGIVLLKTTYSDDAGPRQALLSLTFALEDDQWRLVFDQNTRIVEE